MNLRSNHRLVRIPPVAGRKEENTGILDENNKLVAYCQGVKRSKDRWEWVRADARLSYGI